MKKVVLSISLVLLTMCIIAVGGFSVYAKGGRHGRLDKVDKDFSCESFVDENSDGVCDNKPVKPEKGEKPELDASDDVVVDESDDVAPEAKPEKPVKGEKPAKAVCADEDGDGVCDNFVDEDGDGVCDEKPVKGEKPELDASDDVVVDESDDVAPEAKPEKPEKGEKPAKAVCADEDGDGVCDSFVDEDADGVCDHRAAKPERPAKGDNCVDENGDGVCDNKPEKGEKPQDGTGKRYGKGNGGKGNRFNRVEGEKPVEPEVSEESIA